MNLFRSFPTFHPLLKQEQHFINPIDRQAYPAFSHDFALLDTDLMPVFHELDNEALSQQNWYRWLYILTIFGGALTTILIVLQIAFFSVPGFDIAGTIITALLGLATAFSRSFKNHEHYLDARLAAERLRSEYFLFLAHLDSYSDEQSRETKLRQRISEIRKEGFHDASR